MRGRTGWIWREVAETVLYGWFALAVAAYALATFDLFPEGNRWAEASGILGVSAVSAAA